MRALVLWPHQQQAVDAAAAQLTGNGRALLVMACGTGKTRTGAEASRRVAASGKVLVVVPTQELLAQTARVYAEHLGAAAGMIGAVCAEQAATGDAAQVRGDLAGLDAGVSTDPADVAAWLRSPGRASIFTTYASLPVIAAAHGRPGVADWDLAVVDEAHRAAGLAGRAWSLINDDAAIPAARRLYMTATPRLMPDDGRDDVVSMDNEKVFGPEVFRVSFGWAIRQGLLADYRVAVVVVTSTEVAELTASEQLVAPGGTAVPARMLAAQLALLKAARQHGLHRIITYHQRVSAARRFAETLPQAACLLPAAERPPAVHAGSVDGSMRLTERRQILSHLEAPGDRTVVVSNSRVLSEGVDVPDLDAVMFADPRDSATDVVQATGRALRRGSRAGKTATIIIPVLVTEAESPEAALDGSQFGAVWRVVRALRAHDERMATWLDHQRIAQARTEGDRQSALPEPPAWLSVTGAPVSADFAAAVQVRIIATAAPVWLDGYARAAAWHERHGHLLVPVRHVTGDGFGLGAWIGQQRSLHGKCQLAADRVALLDGLGMIWDVLDESWMRAYQDASAWHARHAHLEVPETYRTGDGRNLAEWLSHQRAAYHAGTLAAERIALLEQIGLAWDGADGRWQRRLTQLTDALARYGGQQNLPPGSPEALWLEHQRAAAEAGRLPTAKIAVLEGAGLVLRRADQWQVSYQALKDYHAAHGHFRVPRGTLSPDGSDLSGWVTSQRRRRTSGELTGPQQRLLQEIGFTWDAREDTWHARYADARDFHEQHGHLRTPSRALNYWLRQQRTRHQAGALTDDQARLLSAIGGLDDPATMPSGRP